MVLLMTTVFIIVAETLMVERIFLVHKSSKPYQIRNIALSTVLPNQRINLRREKVVRMY